MNARGGGACADLLRTVARDAARGVAAAAVVGLFVNLLSLVVPFYMLQVYDRVIGTRSVDTLVVLTALTLAVLLFLAMLDFIRGRIFAIVAERVVGRLGTPALAAAIETALRHRAGAAVNVMRDLAELRQFVAGGPMALPLDVLVTPLFLAVLFLLHPLYGLVGLIAAVLLGAIGVLVEILARRPAALAAEAALRVQLETSTAIRNAEVIAAMGMLPAVARRWRRAQSRALALAGAGQGVAKGAASIAKSVRMGLQVAMLATGAMLVIDHAVSAGSIAAAAIIMGRLLFPFEQLIEGWRQWCGAFGTVARLRELLREGTEARAAVPLAAESGALVVDRVSFLPSGGDRPVLRGVSFALEPGEVLGVVGPSGAGKSTLARLIVGLWRPTTGGIYLDGHDTFTWERESFGRGVGYLPQSAALLDGTVRENIARFAEVDPAEVIAAAKAAGVHELIGRLPWGYETPIGEGSHLLSGGQRQRLALARALFGRPRLLVLDEPNSNLDVEGEQAFVRAVAAAKDAGTTVVIVAQRMSILSVADHLLVLRDGAVAQFGPRQEMMKPLVGQAADGRPGDAKIARLPVGRQRRP